MIVVAMKQRDIFIVSQEGLNPQINLIAEEAIAELMACFPSYKDDYPITNLGAWKDENHQFTEKGKIYLAPYKSTEWHILNAKEQAKEDGRDNQLNASTLFQTMQQDPTNKTFPQFTVLLTLDDLYPSKDMNYCLGIGDEGIGCVVSVNRFLDHNNNLNVKNFKTVLMHEFGHVIGLTEPDRKNTEELYGTHCKNLLCIMQQRADGNYNSITESRLALKRNKIPPICDDCIESGNNFFAKERQNNHIKSIVQQTVKNFKNR
ncbi:MAG: hypothetical protein PHE89_04735 [Alphaproteobacteria bacterium]|nr:hypothetical protein [Alphaproteobacteria bacterium]